MHYAHYLLPYILSITIYWEYTLEDTLYLKNKRDKIELRRIEGGEALKYYKKEYLSLL